MIKIPAAGFDSVGSIWEDKYEDNFIRISQICVSYQEIRVCSLQFYYLDQHGNFLLSPLYGNDKIKGSQFIVVSLDSQKEFLTGLSGVYGSYHHNIVNSLTFETNKKSYGPFGSTFMFEDLEEYNWDADGVGATTFDYPLGKVEVFNGFHGSSNPSGITSIGLFIKPRPVSKPEPVVKTETALWIWNP